MMCGNAMAARTSGKYLLRNVYLLSAVSAITCAALTALFSWQHLQQHRDEAHAASHRVETQRLIADIQAMLLRPDWSTQVERIDDDITQLLDDLPNDSPDLIIRKFIESWDALRDGHDASNSQIARSDPLFAAFVSDLDQLGSHLEHDMESANHGHFGSSGSTRHLWLAGLILACGAWGVGWLLAAIVRSQRAVEDAHATLEERVSDRTAELADRNVQLHDEVERRRELELEILTIASEEQRRIAGYLHDDLGQRLTGLALGTKTLERQLPEDARQRAEELTQQATATSVALRNIVRGLYPSKMNRDELIHALDALAADTHAHSGCGVNIDAEGALNLPNEAENVQIYGIVREAVTNAVRHGHAKNIDIRLATSNGMIALTVIDDGSGFEETNRAETEGVGLQLMRYRADILRGSIAIESLVGSGVRVDVEFPMGEKK